MFTHPKQNLTEELKSLFNEWKELRNELQLWMFNTNPSANQTSIREKVTELKEQYHLYPNFNSLTPRILAEPSAAPRDQAHIDKYLNLFSKMIDIPEANLQKSLESFNTKRTTLTLGRAHFAAFAFLIAFKHHLYSLFCQENSNTDAFADYLFTRLSALQKQKPDMRLQRNEIKQAKNAKRKRHEKGSNQNKTQSDIKKERLNQLPLYGQINAIIKSELQEARKTKIEKRAEFNKTLAVDHLQDLSIQQLINQGFTSLEVTVQPLDLNRKKIKQTQFSGKPKVISSNTIVVDKATKKVLGILITEQFTEEETKQIKTELENKSASFWKKDARSGTKNRDSETKMNKGKQATFGEMNFTKKENSLTTTTAKAPQIWEKLQVLGGKMSEIYKKHLPNSFQSAIKQTKEFSEGGLTITREHKENDNIHVETTPFTTTSVNFNNPVLGHRDHNYHNIAAMLVLENELKEEPTLTSFPEWHFQESGKDYYIAFHVPNRSVLIADTDYIHLVPEVTSNRFSFVWYTYKDIMVSPLILSYDSDLDEADYEETSRPKKRARTVEKKAETLPVQRDEPMPQAHLPKALETKERPAVNRHSHFFNEIKPPIKELSDLLSELYNAYVVLSEATDNLNYQKSVKERCFSKLFAFLNTNKGIVNQVCDTPIWGDLNAMEIVTVWNDFPNIALISSLGGRIRKESKFQIEELAAMDFTDDESDEPMPYTENNDFEYDDDFNPVVKIPNLRYTPRKI